MNNKIEVQLLLILFVEVIMALKCPEITKKPHQMSCRVFFNCVNLPNDGYVWVPSKCSDGLVFQPFLGTCVLPGDSWTCEETPAGVNYPHQGEPVSIVPKIEIEPEDENENQEDQSFGFTEDPEDFTETYSPELNFGDVNSPLFGEIPSNGSEISKPTGESGTKQPVSLFQEFLNNYFIENHMKNTDLTKNNLFLQYLVKNNYVFKNDFKIGKKNSEKSDNSENAENVGPHGQSGNSDKIPDVPDSEGNSDKIISLKGTLGGSHYLTIPGFKSLYGRLKSPEFQILPCTRNVWLPNVTDCRKYYTCEPDTATVVEYSCPGRTSFNRNKKICDTRRNADCRTDESLETRNFLPEDSFDLEPERSDTRAEVCRSIGKTRDPESKKHFFACYSEQGVRNKLQAIRMSCPDRLVFCDPKKICTFESLC